MAQIEEKTREIKVGYLVEIAFKVGELEIKSDPSRAKVFVDGKEFGETPIFLSEIKIGRHQIRITKEGCEPWGWDVTIEAGKKLEILAKLEKKRDVDWSRKKFEAPAWNVGDQWSFKDVTGLTWSDEVLDDKEGLYILKREGIKDLFGYDKKTMNAMFLIRESGRSVENKSLWRKILDFPIFVGKTWTETMTSIPTGSKLEAVYVCDFKIEGTEEVSTPAGTFKTFKIYCQQTNKTSGNSGWARFWYSPEAKTWVKREIEKSFYWAKVRILDAELVSYRLK